MNFLKKNNSNLLFGIACIFLYLVFGYDLIRSNFTKLILLYAALFAFTYSLIKNYGWNFWLLAGMGVVFRLVLFPAVPNLSQDFYRFLWDGRLLVQGINPYLITPELYITDLSTALEVTGAKTVPQAQELYDGMGVLNGSHYSNYPPINQLIFGIASLFTKNSIIGSVIVLKVIMLLADLGILYFGRKLLIKLKLPEKRIFWYFLNPFIIIEMTGNLHFESVMLFFLVLALYLLFEKKWIWAAVILGISISVKLLPLLFLPLFYSWFFKKEVSTALNLTTVVKFYIIVIGTVLLTFAPFLSSEFISNFSTTIGLWFQTFEFNASIYYIIRWIGFETIGWNIIETVGKILPIITILSVFSLALFRRSKTDSDLSEMKHLITSMLFAVAIYFLFSTTVHPWYIATPLLLSVFTKYKFPIVWSLMVFLSYSTYGEAGFHENLWLVALEYIAVIGFFLWECYTKKALEKTDLETI